MTSSPEQGPRPPHPSQARGGPLDGAGGSIAASVGTTRTSRESALLRGGTAAQAAPRAPYTRAVPVPAQPTGERRTAVRRAADVPVPVAEDVRDSVITIVMTLVEDLLCRELALAEDPVVDAVRRALTLCPADEPTVVRLHPDDLAELPAEALAELPDTVRVVGDRSVERAGAVAETGPTRVDAQLGAALERVRAVLAP